MNKLWAIVALAMATNYSFAAAGKKPAEPKPFEGKPTVVLQVFDISTKVARPIQGTTMSISKKQNQLCWHSINVPTQNKVMIAEAFYAPAKMKLSSPGSRVDSSEDGKNHTIITETNLVNHNQPLSRCWGFDKTDPIGKYKMDVQINDQVFKGLEFEIVK
ncbi:hypothetical protein [Mannheimia indoligenes]|uniref:hypothetical protein n=1 Tax=Mannheimia indoligenes TaxID=3103145 RepID=UPI002FE6AAE3